jgi:uncharacterized protein YegP (UPF0339 family)
MLVEKNYLLVCENFIADQRNRNSLINCYDTMFFDKLPAHWPLLKVVGNVKISGNTGKAKQLKIALTIMGPKKEEVFRLEPQLVPINAHMTEQNLNIVFDVEGLQFKDYGKYTIQLKANGATVAKSDIYIKQALPNEA